MANKYNAAELEELGKKGEAFKKADGSYSYPIADAEDLTSAIHAVGMGSADHESIRVYIIQRAKALGLESQIPDTWKADGSLRTASADPEPCSLCDGDGEMEDGSTCPACKGSGEERKVKRTRSRSLAERRAKLHAGYQRRTFTFEPGAAADALGLSVRSAAGGKVVVPADGVIPLVGYAIRYGAAYDVSDRLGTFSETMRSGACSQTISDGDDVVFMYDHDSLVMGRRSAGTLHIDEDVNGLPIAVDLDSRQQIARDLAVAIERGDVTQMSVGFTCSDDEWNSAGTVRNINAIRLFDVSAVGIPASPTTSIAIADSRASDAMDEARSIIHTLLDGMTPVAGELAEEHRSMNQADTASLGDALGALHLADDFALPVIVVALQAIDEALDAAQSGVSEVLGIPDPDGDPDDLEPALVRQRDMDLIAIRRRRLGVAS